MYLFSLLGKYSGGSVNMWNRTGQPDQEAVGPSPQHQSHPTHMSMQHVNQDKSSGSGRLDNVCTPYEYSRTVVAFIFLTVRTGKDCA